MSSIPFRRTLGGKLRLAILGTTLATLVLALGATFADGRLAEHAAVSLAVVVLALGAAWGVSRWLEAVVLQPLQAMTDIARDAIRHGVSPRRADKRDDDEVGALVDAFNELLAEIERRRSEQDAAAAEKDREVAERRHAQQ